jgi:hypothetical protein
VFPTAEIPPDEGRQQDESQERNCIIHRQGGYWPYSRQDEDDADKQSPEACPNIDKRTEFAHVPWPWRELAKYKFAEDGNAVTPVEGNRTHVKDASDGCVGSKSDQINHDTPEYRDPNGVKGCSGPPVDYGPDPGAWNESIARKRKDCTSERLLAR